MKRVEEYKNKLKQKLRVEQVVELSSNFVQQYGSTGASYSHNMAPNQVLTNKQKKAFMRDGYLVLRGAVPQEMVEAALKAVDEAFENGQYEIEADKADPVPHFNVEARKHEDIAHIPRQTDVFAACEDLMGKNKAHYGPKGQIAFRQTDLKMIQSGMTMTEAMPAHRYHIDGGHGVLGPTGTPFSLLVGICLSDGQDIDENRGQFNVWPGSHLKLHPVVRERVNKGLVKGPMIFGGRKIKPDIGQPIRVLMRPGDAVLAHQRLGHSGGINLHEKTRKNLYYRLHHKNHDDLWKPTLNGSVFTEFEGLHHLVDDL